MEIQADSTRQLGDPATYGFYVKATGWVTLSSFAVAMAAFGFCDSFPSMVAHPVIHYLQSSSNMKLPDRYLDQVVGRSEHG
jgi:hypothetical protein